MDNTIKELVVNEIYTVLNERVRDLFDDDSFTEEVYNNIKEVEGVGICYSVINKIAEGVGTEVVIEEYVV